MSWDDEYEERLRQQEEENKRRREEQEDRRRQEEERRRRQDEERQQMIENALAERGHIRIDNYSPRFRPPKPWEQGYDPRTRD